MRLRKTNQTSARFVHPSRTVSEQFSTQTQGKDTFRLSDSENRHGNIFVLMPFVSVLYGEVLGE